MRSWFQISCDGKDFVFWRGHVKCPECQKQEALGLSRVYSVRVKVRPLPSPLPNPLPCPHPVPPLPSDGRGEGPGEGEPIGCAWRIHRPVIFERLAHHAHSPLGETSKSTLRLGFATAALRH